MFNTLKISTVLATLLASTGYAAPFVYIPVGNAGKIEVVDAQTGEIVKEYTGLSAVHGLASSADGKYLIAGSFDEREPGTMAPAKPDSVSAEDHAIHHAASPEKDGDAPEMVSTVSILDAETGEIIRVVDVPGAVHHVTTSPDGRFAVVSQPAYDKVSVIDLQSYEVVATVETGSLPNYMTFSADSNTLYVSNAGDDNIAVISTTHWMIQSRINTGTTPEHMVISADGNMLYVNNNDDGTVSSIALATGVVVDTFTIGERLHGLDITSDGSALLVAERDGDNIARVDLASGLVTKQAMGPSPYHMTTIAGTDLAYVSSSDEPVMRIINQSDLSLVGQISISDVGHQMVVSK
ncbi:MAG: YncE family protein [Rhodobacteraceae bacterium]|nr:YncE family protein [Paracoccaceae bacterium]